jgi:hypothetical protein
MNLASRVHNHKRDSFAMPALQLAVMGPQEQENKKRLIVGGSRYETDDVAGFASSGAADGGVRK